MSIFEGYFWKGILPLLWISGVGTGIKFSLRDGELLDSNLLVFPDDISYGNKLKAESLTLVDTSTSEEVLKNILKQRMFPHYSWTVEYTKDKLFQGSSQIKLINSKYETQQGKSLYILDEPDKDSTDKLRADCIKALANTSWNKNQYQKLKEWCTEPTVKSVLERHKFRLLNTDNNSAKDDNHWKEIIGGGWFGDTYKNQQTFIDGDDLDKLSGITNKNKVTAEHINIFKAKCKTSVAEAYVKKSFPATKDFINNLKAQYKSKFSGVDTFQQVALFCTKPVTAEEYIKKAMNGQGASSIAKRHEKDYCYSSTKTDISTYKSTKTYEPFEGKSFWCAVRISYEAKSIKKVE